ncbi:uncharacterized protein LOC127831324 [Dreissena polymorpha]|uniref:uncharacterized protein LOC127831324 n=1 Tax=Dreissena polymorpha TaxID=45954 RepID=UPI002264BD00|nr:uncharacterized protein LOC127831324 [Dreissena polymorpha]
MKQKPTHKVTGKPLSEISFHKSKHGKTRKTRPRQQPAVVVTIDEEEALRRLKKVCPDACIILKNDSDTDTASDDEDMPPILVREHKLSKEKLSAEEVTRECQNIMADFKVTPVQASNLENMTRG